MGHAAVQLEDGKTSVPMWFEKSVEYQFVIQAVQKKLFSLICPLDGDIEGIGDAIFAADSKYIIVEFKLTLDDLSAEYSKYETKAGLSGKDAFVVAVEAIKSLAVDIETRFYLGKHHFLVGGVLEQSQVSASDGSTGQLGIEIVTYFDAANRVGKNRFTFLKMEEIKNAGIVKEDFDRYVEQLLKYKDDDGGSNGGGGGGSRGPRSEALVIGLSGTNSAYTSLANYELLLKAKLRPNRSP